MAARRPAPPATTVRARDGCVVETEPLAAILVGFIDTWNRQRGRPDQLYRSGVPGNQPSPDADHVVTLGAIAWLAEETSRVDPLGVGVPVKTIQNIARLDARGRPSPRSRHTELRIADALVQALERPDLFHDGTLTVRPNPLASREARASCC